MIVRRRNPDATHEVAGPATVADVLAQLGINPETVLVIRDGELMTRDRELPDDAEIEVRSVISGGAGPRAPQCQVCGRAVVIEIPRHRAAFCAEHLVDHIRGQVRHAIDRHGMLSYDDRVLVAVSGGKDSLALWDVLLDMGYHDGLYLGLGIGDYSQRSEQVVSDFAERRGVTLHAIDLATEFGYSIPDATGVKDRSACGVCGLSKRYVFNKVALDHGYDVMATGHNLDDEAAQLLGNVLRWQTPFMARQSPALAASGGLAKKVKPLYRVGEREMAAYCIVRGLDYIVEECPLVGGNTVHHYKDALNELERHFPGTKAQFLYGFLDKVRDQHFASEADEGNDDGVVACGECGMPTAPPKGKAAHNGDSVRCAFCRTQQRVLSVVSTVR
ncbi:ATP-binding protein [Egibacter rhizosphaerae]|nr:ATP-binding protein [Egibacter rhizosphaerae]